MMTNSNNSDPAGEDELSQICERITLLRKSLGGIQGEVLKAADPDAYNEKKKALAKSEMARFCLVYGRGARFP